tara:strand:+ start:199 stop:900 length:702 start_codon:yes stop_codon:yes gene_type:complete
MKGLITIYKVYNDGRKEVLLDRENIITDGMGYSITTLLTDSGSTYNSDYRPSYFSVGTSSVDYDTALSTSASFYSLSAPFSWEDYGLDTALDIEKLDRGFPASTVDGGASYNELYFTTAALSATIFSSSPAYFSHTQSNHTSKLFFDSLESEIVLDETTGNGKTISEIGLFAKNIMGIGKDNPVLIAYKSFTGIPKSKEFSLVFHWTIGFLGISPIIDTVFTGTDKHSRITKV